MQRSLTTAELDLALGRVVPEDAALEAAEADALRAPVGDPGLDETPDPLPEAVTAPQTADLFLVKPQPPEEDAVAPEAARVTLRAPTVADVDRLWDWIREDDPPRLTALRITTSVELHQKIGGFVADAGQGTAACFAVDDAQEHVGFTFLNPIHGPDAALHAYLATAYRGRGVRIAKAVICDLRTRYPTLRLAALTTDPRIMQFARRVGLSAVTYYLSAPEETTS